MSTIKLGTVYHSQFDEIRRDDLMKRLVTLLPEHQIVWSETDIHGLFFLSGGSEQMAVNRLGSDRHATLLAFAEDNAFAAAMETKAYLDDRGIPCDLYNLSEPADLLKLKNQIDLQELVRSFTHQTIAVVGQESPWLIQSTPEPELLKHRLGYQLIRIPWDSLPPIDTFLISPDFLEAYKGFGNKEYENHSRVHTLLTGLIQQHELDGISVDCFSLISQYKLTACLSLALLNHNNFPASCEGDLISLVGMMLIKHLFNVMPWMANISGIFEDSVELSHCTAPLSYLTQYEITTHFESDLGLAIQGQWPRSDYTLLRLDPRMTQAFVSEGTVIDHTPAPNSCRTRVRMSLPAKDLLRLKMHPLGNHHLMIPGKKKELLMKALRFLNITEVTT